MTSESKALRLARYLKEYVGLRSSTVRDVNKYESVLWFGDMPQEADCRSPAWNNSCAPWLEVRKQSYPKQPLPPEEILPWIDQQALMQATASTPELKSTIYAPDLVAPVAEDEEPPLVEHFVRDYPEITRAYEAYCPKWLTWSEQYRRCARVQNVYAELFRLRTQIQKQGELYELVLGLGLLDWRNSANGKSAPILRHVATIPVDLHFDSATGIIRVEAAANGARLRIEDDMLEADLRPGRDHYANVDEQLNAIGDDIWDFPRIHVALKSWATSLHANSEWSPELRPSISSAERSTISFAPALILRRRTQAGMVRIYDALINRLGSETDDVPAGWGGLIEDEDDREFPQTRTTAPDSAVHPNIAPEELYFPLAANREQRRIVEAIRQHRGVLVQGPPGTGKSHTIANLVCHLLATGKRVLITAETGHALRVLKDKLPKEIQPLCVSMLGQGGDAFAELNAAVQGITSRHDAWSPGTHDARITEIDRELSANRRRLAEIDSELRSLRQDETCPHDLLDGSYIGTASLIAERVAAERERFEWLHLPLAVKELPSVSSEDMIAWLQILRKHDGEAIAEANRQIVDTAKLPRPEDFSAAVIAEREVTVHLDTASDLRKHPACHAIVARSPQERAKLAGNLRALMQTRGKLQRLNYKWLREAVVDALSGRHARWQALSEQSQKLIAKIELLLNAVGSSLVSLPADKNARTMRADVIAVIEHLEHGGKWTSFGLFAPKAVKERLYLRDRVTVDGISSGSIETLRVVLNYLELTLAFGDLDEAWADVCGLPASSSPQIRLSAIKEHVSALGEALTFAGGCLTVAQALSTVSPPIPEPNWLDGQPNQWLQFIELAVFEDKLQLATAQVDVSLRELDAVQQLHDAHSVISELIQIIKRRDVGAYSQAYGVLKRIEQTKRDQLRRQQTEALLEGYVPGLAAAVRCTIDLPDWETRFADWEPALRWAIADNWLQKRADVGYQQKRWQVRNDVDAAIGEQLAEAASLRAWTHFFERLTPKDAAALKSWREAVKAMGKGTGRSARMERLKREARQYMEQCRDAIPVWIMPRYLVAEMLDPVPGRYDLVIVDEASQLGIESLFLFYIAKKMVVVGDDQQISPYGVGIADAAIADLQRHYLDDIPHQHALSAQSSLYGNAKIRFRQNVVLREHFRCMPEIIQFSNDLCYAVNGTPLDPLRAYPANRLKPLILRHVPDGYRTGSSQNALNEPEADALLAQMIACIDDRRYEGRTMGVISLQGEAQAKLVEHKLLQRLEPEVIEARRLICGDAYAFQGDERDIIFLSMVAAPGEVRIGTLSTDPARQRFNVAASRARDQLWLFHSATLDVLNPQCMRYRLLNYMLNPGRQTTEETKQRFDSQFERDVFRIISDRGFFVRTQVSVGDPTNHRYRIDLVVEGMQGRLAVECDGDQWHGPERYELDMARQRDLERAGWQFVRIRGSDFYRDPDQALQPLWGELDRYGIKPGGIDEGATEPPPPVDITPVEIEEDVGDARVENDGGTDLDAPDDNRTAPNSDDEINDTNPPDCVPVRVMPKHMVDYVAYDGPCGSDPRTVSQGEIADGICDIIEVEGPMLARRAYDIYLRGCGIRRLGAELKRTLNKALMSAIRQGRVISEKEPDTSGLIYSTVRLKGTPPVKLRSRGPRTLEEIPPSEIREAAVHIADSMDIEYGTDEHLRAILESFDLRRLTAQTSSALRKVIRKLPKPDDLFEREKASL